MKHQLSIVKLTAQKSKCIGGFGGGYTWVLGYCIKVIVICKSLFQNCAVVSDSIGEAMLILFFEAITTACLMFLFANILFVVRRCNIFIITKVLSILSFSFRIQHDKTHAKIAGWPQPFGTNVWVMHIGIFWKCGVRDWNVNGWWLSQVGICKNRECFADDVQGKTQVQRAWAPEDDQENPTFV